MMHFLNCDYDWWTLSIIPWKRGPCGTFIIIFTTYICLNCLPQFPYLDKFWLSKFNVTIVLDSHKLVKILFPVLGWKQDEKGFLLIGTRRMPACKFKMHVERLCINGFLLLAQQPIFKLVLSRKNKVDKSHNTFKAKDHASSRHQCLSKYFLDQETVDTLLNEVQTP